MPDCREYISQEDCGPGEPIRDWDAPLDSLPTDAEFTKNAATHRGRPRLRAPDGQFLKDAHGWRRGEQGDYESGWIKSPPDHGFVAGCIWGDDSSWKIQYLDLSRVEEGILKREERFGYIELPRSVRLRDSIHLIARADRARLAIVISTSWDLSTGKMKPIGIPPWDEE